MSTDTGPVVPVPHLNAEELQVLLHGLARLNPGLPLRRELDTFTTAETDRLTRSLSTALLEALSDARRAAET